MERDYGENRGDVVKMRERVFLIVSYRPEQFVCVEYRLIRGLIATPKRQAKGAGHSLSWC